MALIVPVRSNNAYIGLAKQTVSGTAVAPSLFPRWLDGSQIEVTLKDERILEGDGTRRLSQVIKNQQYTKIKLVCLPRPVELGFLESAAMGSGSDSITTQSPSDTLAAGVTGGTSTTCTLTTGGTPFVASGGGTYQLLVGQGTANAELVTFNAITTSGTTLTVASSYNGGKFALSHSSGDPIASVAVTNTSFTAPATAGAGTITLGGNFGLTGSGTATLVLSPGLNAEETVTISTPASSGTYVYTLANNAALKKSHASGDAVLSPVTHVLTDQIDGNYYTVEVGLGSLNSGPGTTLRVRDCKVDTIKRSAKAGQLLEYEVEFVGIASIVQGTPATITLENHSAFYYDTGVWNLDGSLTGDALEIETFALNQKNGLDTGIQSESLTLDATIFGAIAVTLTADAVFTSATRLFNIYFGGATGTTDAQAIYSGSLTLTFTQVDGFHSLVYTITTLHYTKGTWPAMKADGKHYKLPFEAESVTNQGLNTFILQSTINNTKPARY